MKTNGFSLMELLIALVIIAIIAGVAYPKYQKLVTRSKQTEVKNILKAIQLGQDLYHTTHLKYASNLAELDVEIPSNVVYQYTLITNDQADEFEVTAKANIDGDAAIDQWTINHRNQLANTINDVIEE
jgi:type IV pilus assembly protein PilE